MKVLIHIKRQLTIVIQAFVRAICKNQIAPPLIREARRTVPYKRHARVREPRMTVVRASAALGKGIANRSLVERLARLLLLCMCISLIAMVLGGLVWSYQHQEQLFAKVPVRQVIVHAPMEHLPQETLQTLVEPYVDKGFFSVDLGELKNRLESEPWIGRASISRSWPASIEIKVAERRPIAVWGGGRLMDNQGALFQPSEPVSDAVLGGLPKLEAPDHYSGWVLQQYHQINHIFRAIDVKIETLALNAQMSWNLTLDNGISLKVDRSNALEKIMQLVAAYPRLALMERPIEQIDLRYINGFSVKWVNETDSANS